MSEIDVSKESDDRLEELVAGQIPDAAWTGAVRPELTRRQRAWNVDQAKMRRDFETSLFNAQGEREVKRKQFEEALAERQMDHAASLADKQLDAAKSVAAATRLAAWAAGFSALGAMILAGVEIMPYLAGK